MSNIIFLAVGFKTIKPQHTPNPNTELHSLGYDLEPPISVDIIISNGKSIIGFISFSIITSKSHITIGLSVLNNKSKLCLNLIAQI